MDGLRSVPVTARTRGKVTAVVCYTLLQCSRPPLLPSPPRSGLSCELGMEASDSFPRGCANRPKWVGADWRLLGSVCGAPTPALE